MGSIGIKFPTIPVSVTKHPATLPEADIPDAIDTEAIANAALPSLLDLDTIALTENAIWRDHMALSGTFRTIHSRDLVARHGSTSLAEPRSRICRSLQERVRSFDSDPRLAGCRRISPSKQAVHARRHALEVWGLRHMELLGKFG